MVSPDRQRRGPGAKSANSQYTIRERIRGFGCARSGSLGQPPEVLLGQLSRQRGRRVTSSCWCKKAEGVARRLLRGLQVQPTPVLRGLQVQPAPVPIES